MKKIMFNDKYGLTQAVLEGRKTQTRRIVPKRIIEMVPGYQDEYYSGALESISVEDAIYNITHGERMARAQFYVCEEVAVAQSYKDICGYKDITYVRRRELEAEKCNPAWHNKMFVRADLMLHFIKITNVRVERLQDISDEDCLKEGIMEWNPKDETDDVIIRNILECNERNGHFPFQIPRCWNMYNTPRQAFADLIDKVSGKGTWDSNPYVFVYDFELIK